MSKVADRIRECREAANMGVDDLAKIIGKNRATVYRYEKGEIENYPTEVIGKLATALGVSPGYLMGWTDIKEPQDEQRPVIRVDDEREELNRLFDSLDADRKAQAMSYLRYLATETGR